MFPMDEDKQQKVLKNFKRVIDKRDIRLLNKDLYYHLNLNCNFDAHFNLEGFREEYGGTEGFGNFISLFDHRSPYSQWLDAPEISVQFREMNQEMLNYVSSRLE